MLTSLKCIKITPGCYQEYNATFAIIADLMLRQTAHEMGYVLPDNIEEPQILNSDWFYKVLEKTKYRLQYFFISSKVEILIKKPETVNSSPEVTNNHLLTPEGLLSDLLLTRFSETEKEELFTGLLNCVHNIISKHVDLNLIDYQYICLIDNHLLFSSVELFKESLDKFQSLMTSARDIFNTTDQLDWPDLWFIYNGEQLSCYPDKHITKELNTKVVNIYNKG